MNEEEYKTFSISAFPESVRRLVKIRAAERGKTIREHIIDVVVEEARREAKKSATPSMRKAK